MIKFDAFKDMGVFKWMRRERVTVTTRGPSNSETQVIHQENQDEVTKTVNTIRTEEYKRDLAEFQARRSIGGKDAEETPPRKKCSRHSLPISCTDCATDQDATFNYEKRSGTKYPSRRTRSEMKANENLPSIQFLFQNQVFMPGDLFTQSPDGRRYKRVVRSPEIQVHHREFSTPEDLRRRQIDFNDDIDQTNSPPMFYKNNSLPVDPNKFLMGTDEEEVDGGIGKSNSSGSSRSCGEKLVEVMSELKNFDDWADEQLRATQSLDSSRVEEYQSDVSALGLPIVTISDLDVTIDKNKMWNKGKWGTVPVQIKKISGLTVSQIKKKENMEINILRKCRHPNIILLMGLYPDYYRNIYLICERCVDSLFTVIHIQGKILSAQTAVQYIADIADALVFLRMRGYIHTQLTSHSIMITNRGAAKLADLAPCCLLRQDDEADRIKEYDTYNVQPHYVNIGGIRNTGLDCEPLLTKNPSEVYLSANAVAKEYKVYQLSDDYRWQPPEVFQPDDKGLVYPCSKSDVYSLSLILWECCNAKIPLKPLSYSQLSEQYSLWRVGMTLPADGSYPGCLLELLQLGLDINREARPDINTFAHRVQNVKIKMDKLEYIVIPARIPKKPTFSSLTFNNSSPTNSISTPRQCNTKSYETSESERSDVSPLYESIKRDIMFLRNRKDLNLGDEKDYSSACSTPISKARGRINTPRLHRSDSTEYCSIMSVDRKNALTNGSKDESVSIISKPTNKLNQSVNSELLKPDPVPESNTDTMKSLPNQKSANEKSALRLDLKNYSLPNTPIARSNKLRKIAWLFDLLDKAANENEEVIPERKSRSAPETPAVSTASVVQLTGPTNTEKKRDGIASEPRNVALPKKPVDQETLTPEVSSNTWSFKSTLDRTPRKRSVESDALSLVNVKPLVAIHEKWIYEANKKIGRSMSLPENNSNRAQIPAVKPASHCVDTLQKSLPQLNIKRSTNKFFRGQAPPSPGANRNGGPSEKFCQARDAIAKLNLASRDFDSTTWRKSNNSSNSTSQERPKTEPAPVTKVDRSTDTKSVEEYIRQVIRKEIQNILLDANDEQTSGNEVISKSISNIIESLKEMKEDERKEKFSCVTVTGNNKPLLQISFSKTGENNLQVMDNRVNVTINDQTFRLNQSVDEATDELNVNTLKRCQGFNALQEARSTEDLYIDDDLSTQMQENFGGKVKLIPLHGSLHEVLCEKENECCLIKVKEENGCDTIYFRCDNSDTESRDAIDGKDTLIYKRSISLVEERFERVLPPKRKPVRTRPKSEVSLNIQREDIVKSNSTPTLNDSIEVNIDKLVSHDSEESDEEFIKLEDEIEKEISCTKSQLDKISEEDLSREDLSSHQSDLEQVVQ